MIKIAQLSILILCLSFFISCKKDPSVSFSVSNTKPETDEIVTFVNTSTNADSYSWDFGDNTQSTEKSPTHAYTQAGDYNVTLLVSSKDSKYTENTVMRIVVSDPAPYFRGTIGSIYQEYLTKDDDFFDSYRNYTSTGSSSSSTVIESSISSSYSSYTPAIFIQLGTIYNSGTSGLSTDAFIDFIKAKSYPFSDNAFNGVSITYRDNSTTWSTDFGSSQPSSSNFTITEIKDISANNSSAHKTISFKATFSARLYDQNGFNYKDLTNCQYLGVFANY